MLFSISYFLWVNDPNLLACLQVLILLCHLNCLTFHFQLHFRLDFNFLSFSRPILILWLFSLAVCLFLLSSSSFRYLFLSSSNSLNSWIVFNFSFDFCAWNFVLSGPLQDHFFDEIASFFSEQTLSWFFSIVYFCNKPWAFGVRFLDVFFCVFQVGLSTKGSSEGVKLRERGSLLNPCWASYMDGGDWWEFSKQERDETQLKGKIALPSWATEWDS